MEKTDSEVLESKEDKYLKFKNNKKWEPFNEGFYFYGNYLNIDIDMRPGDLKSFWCVETFQNGDFQADSNEECFKKSYEYLKNLYTELKEILDE